MKEQMREAFEAWWGQAPIELEPLKPRSINENVSVWAWQAWQAALSAVPESHIGDSSEMVQPTDISKQLREYAADSGYSHNDYADTMLAAASEIERLTTSQAQQESEPVVWGYAWQCKSMGDWRIEKLGEGCIPPKDTLALYVIPPAPEGDKT